MEGADFDSQLAELERRLERVRILYEQYFMGMERMAPLIARKDVERRMHALRKAQIRNTARKFKLQTLRQRYSTLCQHWRKTCRQIENGTYHRHLKRAQRRFGGAANDAVDDAVDDAAESTREDGNDLVFDLGASLAEDLATDAEMREAVGRAFDALGRWAPAAPRPSGEAKRRDNPVGKPPPLPNGSAGKPTVKKLAQIGKQRSSTKPAALPPQKTAAAATGQAHAVKRLHEELTRARQKLQQPGRISEAALAKTIEKTRARLLSKHGSDRRIEFRVAVKNGKAVLKPIVK